MAKRRDETDETEEERAAREKQRDQYPLDPGAAYVSEPEPEDQSFSEPEHWVKPGRRRRNG